MSIDMTWPPDDTSSRCAVDRREHVRSHAEESGLDGVLVYSWRRGLITGLTGYAPGFVTNDACLWVPVAGSPVVGVRFPFEIPRARLQTGLDVRHAPTADRLLPATARSIGLLCGDGAVTEGGAHLLSVLSNLPVATTDLAPWFDEQREIKSSSEVVGLRRAASVGNAALEAAGPQARVGRTDFEIVAAVEGRARSLGAMRAECLIGFGRGAVVSEAYGRVLGAGDAIGLELNMNHGGYFSHAQATVLPRHPHPVYERAINVAREARNSVVAHLFPGSPVVAAVAAGDEVLAKHDLLPYKEYDFGHGIGWDTPEHPRLLASSDRIVREGSVIAVHCGLRRDDGETAYTGGPVHILGSGAVELVDNPAVVIRGAY